MIPLPLTTEESRSLRRVLHSKTRTIRSGVRIMDMQERTIWRPSADDIIEGQVTQGAPDNGPSRALNVSIYDPRARIEMDVDLATGDAVPPAAYLVAATYGLWLPDLEKWVDVPVHMGPATSAVREGRTLVIESQSMERRAMASPWKRIVVRKNQLKTDAIEELLREGAGQLRFDLPESRARLAEDIKIGPWADSLTPWQAANRIAKSLGWFIWADARGTVRARRRPSATAWTFTDDEVVEAPKVTGDALDLTNHVDLTGATKNKKTIHVARSLPASHGLSEMTLIRNGALYRRTEFIQDDSITTTAEAEDVVSATLRAHASATMEVEMTTLVNPLLERHDIIATDGAPRTRFATGAFSLGLGVMQVNSVRKSVRWRRPLRGRR